MNHLEDRMVEITATENRKKNEEKKWRQTNRPLGQHQMHQDSHYCGPRRRTKWIRTRENIWRDKSWKLPKHGKGHSQPSSGTTENPWKNKPRRNTQRHIVIKLTKIKDRDKILKATRKKWQITYKGIPIRLSADFSTEDLQTRREWHDIFKVMKGKNLQPRILYPKWLFFRFQGGKKSFPDQTSKS